MEESLNNKKIHLVILGQDASILDESSEAAHRMRMYGESFEGISVYVFAKKIQKKKNTYKNIFVSGFSTFLEFLLACVQICKEIQSLKKKGKIVLITTQDPFEIGLVGLLLSRITRVLLHVQVHTDISSRYMQRESIRARAQIFIARFVLKRANRIRVVSKRIKEFCINLFKVCGEKIDCVSMVYGDLHKNVDNLTDIKPEKKIFLVPTRFVSLKRVPYIVDAFALALKQDDSTQLCIVGSGPNEKEIIKAIKENNISHKVVIIPWVSDMNSLYKNAYAVLVASLYEGWCRVASESVMHHVPVIMTDVGCANEWLEDRKQGIVVPVEDKNAFVSAIVDIVNKEGLHDALVSGCIAKSQTIPSFGSYAKQVVMSWTKTISQIK